MSNETMNATLLGRSPDASIVLELAENRGGRSADARARRYVNRCGLPEESGVYVVRFQNIRFSRLRGESSILKVGSAEGLKARFDAYNKKMAATTDPRDLGALLSSAQNARTDFHFMWLIPKLLERDAIVLDFYLTTEPVLLESDFVSRCLTEYWELPPLNLVLGRQRQPLLPALSPEVAGFQSDNTLTPKPDQ